MILVKKLTKIYEGGEKPHKVLNAVSFRIKKGEFAIITGRSGSGKSTLLYQIGLLDSVLSNTIWFNKIDVSRLKEDERADYRLKKCGFIFQHYGLLPTLTAKENVMLPLLMGGYSAHEASSKAAATLKQVALSNKNNYYPSQLSGGQQQRVSLARAINNSPEIIFADEPTANLDSESATTIISLLKNLHSNGMTVVMVTHEKEYLPFAEHILTLSDGKIINDSAK